MATTYSVYNQMLKSFQDKFISNYNKIYDYIVDFISKNGEALGSRNPGKYVFFTKADYNNFLDAVGCSEADVKAIINASPHIQKTWKIATNPLNMVMCVLVFFYYSLRDNYKNMQYPPHKFVNLMFALRFYSSLQQRQFKYEVNEEVMEYTIENLSKKYNLTKVNSMFELISYYADSNIITWQDAKKMDQTTDKVLVDYMNKLNVRLSSFIKNVAKEYYKNHEDSKRIMEENQEIEYDEGKSQLKVQTNISTDISLVSRAVLQGFRTNPVDVNLLNIACKHTRASFTEMHAIMNTMKLSDDQNLEELIVNMLSYYLISEKMPVSAIKNEEFLKKMVIAYGVSHTNDQYIIKIKEILDLLMEKHSEFYTKTNRASTKVEMRAATYRYFVYIIMKYCE